MNHHLPHILILPEDKANREIVNGFLLADGIKPNQVKALKVAGGWANVTEEFLNIYVPEMVRHPQRFMILLVDLDGKIERVRFVKQSIPEQLTGRVFVLGVLTEPEQLKKRLGSFEQIGKSLATDCIAESDLIWDDPLLQHNKAEVARMKHVVRPILVDQI